MESIPLTWVESTQKDQCSLNNISINLQKILQNTTTTNTNTNTNTNTSRNTNTTSMNENNIYDVPIAEIYGNHTCIFFEMTKDIFQIRFLNTNTTKTISKKQFYIQIPILIENSYTVIIVEKINDNKREIVAIHSPANTKKSINIITPNVI